MIDSSQLIRDLQSFGYWNPSDNLTDEDRFNLVPDTLYTKFGIRYAPKLKALIWRLSGQSKQSFVSALESSGIFSQPIKKAVKTDDKSKSPRDQIKDSAAILTGIYQIGERQIHDEILDSLQNNDTSELNETIKSIRLDLLDQGKQWIDDNVQPLYLSGANNTTSSTTNKGHLIAIGALSSSLLSKLNQSDTVIGQFVNNTIIRLQKAKAKGLLSQEPHLAQEYQDLQDEMEESDGIPAHHTIDGKTLMLGSYLAMLALTSAREIYNEGKVNSNIERGNDLVKISEEDNPNTCIYCQEWAGQIVSISGGNSDYPSLDDAISGGVWHPSCVHTLVDLD